MIFDLFENLEVFQSTHEFLERIDTDFDGQTDAHFTDPHWVEGYVTDDGIAVHGYWRDGDGDTDIDLHKEDGGGYYAHDPYEANE